MKKALSFILLIFYFAFSSGVVVNLHYCMNRLNSFSFGAAESEICGKCGMYTADADGCCHDELKVVKIDDDQLTSSVNLSFNLPAIVQQSDFFEPTLFTQNTSEEFPDNHSPPLSRQNTYLLNCVFRI